MAARRPAKAMPGEWLYGKPHEDSTAVPQAVRHSKAASVTGRRAARPAPAVSTCGFAPQSVSRLSWRVVSRLPKRCPQRSREPAGHNAPQERCAHVLPCPTLCITCTLQERQPTVAVGSAGFRGGGAGAAGARPCARPGQPAGPCGPVPVTAPRRPVRPFSTSVLASVFASSATLTSADLQAGAVIIAPLMPHDVVLCSRRGLIRADGAFNRECAVPTPGCSTNLSLHLCQQPMP